MKNLTALFRSTAGAGAVEFAIVLPLFLILLFGVIDAGRFAWEYNRAEKATQVGARVVIVTNVLSTGLRDADYANQDVGGTTISPGGRIPAGALGQIKCTSTSCTCATNPCPSPLGTFDSTTFNDVLVARMKAIQPTIEADNVEVQYSGSGFGFAGSSGGGGGGGGGGAEEMEISPLITVSLANMKFHPITCLVFLCEISMPTVATTLTAEDASGAYSN